MFTGGKKERRGRLWNMTLSESAGQKEAAPTRSSRDDVGVMRGWNAPSLTGEEKQQATVKHAAERRQREKAAYKQRFEPREDALGNDGVPSELPLNYSRPTFLEPAPPSDGKRAEETPLPERVVIGRIASKAEKKTIRRKEQNIKNVRKLPPIDDKAKAVLPPDDEPRTPSVIVSRPPGGSSTRKAGVAPPTKATPTKAPEAVQRKETPTDEKDEATEGENINNSGSTADVDSEETESEKEETDDEMARARPPAPMNYVQPGFVARQPVIDKRGRWDNEAGHSQRQHGQRSGSQASTDKQGKKKTHPFPYRKRSEVPDTKASAFAGGNTLGDCGRTLPSSGHPSIVIYQTGCNAPCVRSTHQIAQPCNLKRIISTFRSPGYVEAETCATSRLVVPTHVMPSVMMTSSSVRTLQVPDFQVLDASLVTPLMPRTMRRETVDEINLILRNGLTPISLVNARAASVTFGFNQTFKQHLIRRHLGSFPLRKAILPWEYCVNFYY